MGNVEKSIAMQCMRSGSPLPDRIQNKPRLSEGLSFIWESFFELDSERHHGNGLQKIPWSSIIRYGSYHGMSYDEMEDFVYLIRRMDASVLSRLDAQQKTKNR